MISKAIVFLTILSVVNGVDLTIYVLLLRGFRLWQDHLRCVTSKTQFHQVLPIQQWSVHITKEFFIEHFFHI